MSGSLDLITEAKRLIRFNTVTSVGNAVCAVYVGSLLRKLGAEVSFQESRWAEVLFMNVVGVIGQGKDPLLLSTHLDTVAAGDPKLWTKTGQDPWRLTLRGGSLYGLGVADTKLDLLCKLLALSRLNRSDFKRPVILLGSFGEESGLRGAARFCQGQLPRPKMALVGEPSELALVTRHKGLLVAEILFKSRGLHRPRSAQWMYEVSFRGQASHSSTPELGHNAVEASLGFLQDLKKRYGKVSVLSWEGGTGHNVIPASAAVRFLLGEHPRVTFPFGSRGSRSLKTAGRHVRVQRLEAGWYPTLPWEEAAWSLETLGKLLAPYQKPSDPAFRPPHLTWNVTRLIETKQGWSLTFDVRSLPGQPIHRVIKAFEGKLWKRLGPPGPTWQFLLERDNPALDFKIQAPLVKLAKAACRSARLPVRISAKAGCSEAGLYQRVGIPSLVFGPGRAAGNIHQPNESVSLRQLKQAIRFYEAFLRRTCL